MIAQQPGSPTEADHLRALVAEHAHDLSNALGAIMNYTAFLAEDLRGNASAEAYLPHLERAVDRAVGLVERLSTLDREGGSPY